MPEEQKKPEERKMIVEPLDIDAAIKMMLEEPRKSAGKEANPSSEPMHISEAQLKSLIASAREIFLGQSSLIELESPVNVCGDIHGQFRDLLELFHTMGEPGHSNFLFLGDYVDRGKQSLETIALVFCYKVKYRENFFLLRGNHESQAITRVYGFYDECKRRYSVKVWKLFIDAFNCMSPCALIGSKILCMHGGISPLMQSLQDLKAIYRPTDIPDAGIMCDLLWADPEPSQEGFEESARGVSYTFGIQALQNFCKRFGLDMIARAHQVVEDGYEFFGDKKCVTIFSAPNYCGEFDNNGAVMSVDAKLKCSFTILGEGNGAPKAKAKGKAKAKPQPKH